MTTAHLQTPTNREPQGQNREHAAPPPPPPPPPTEPTDQPASPPPTGNDKNV